MLSHYVKIALRGLRRQPLFVGINVVGLGVGAACCLLLVLYVRHELSYDTYHEDADRVYRLLDYGGFGDTKEWGSYVGGDPTEAMRTSFSGVETATKLKLRCGSDRIQLGESVYRDVSMACAEPQLFDVFSFELARGAAEALKRPDADIITRSLAERLFGETDPVGKALPVELGDSTRTFQVAGLMEDVPPNTHFTLDLVLAYEALRSTSRCLDCGQPMYARLAPEGDPEEVAAQALRHIREIDGKEYIEDLRLEPITEVHFSEVPAPRQGDQRQVYVLTGIAALILLIGCANYMNLATARFARRIHEVGVRKAIGARRRELVGRFLVETLVITGCALALALPLTAGGLPVLNAVADAELQLTWDTGGALAVGIGVLLVGISMLAGSYPALFFASARPADVLRGEFPGGLGTTGLRKGLVTFQFVAAIALIAVTAIMAQQLRFVQQKDLGFESDQVVIVRVADRALAQQPERLRAEFGRLASARAVTAGFGVPTQGYFPGRRFIHRPNGEDGPSITFVMPAIDEHFLETFAIPLLAGRNISSTVEPEELEGLINEEGLQAMGWTDPAEALGETIGRATIVGVVPNFHYESLHVPIEPLIMQQNPSGQAGQVALRVGESTVEDVLADLQQVWARLGSEQPLETTFLSDHLRGLYEQERRSAQVFGLFAGLAILIACLGLFGLATFAAERRTQEIGIRKALGASVGRLAWLLMQDTGRLAVLGLLLAAPLAYWAGQRWLDDFAYRIDIGVSPLLAAGAVALAVAAIATGTQAVRAARTNPADALRYE